MTATTTQGTGPGSAADIKPKIYNGTVKSENIDPNTVITSDVVDGAVTTAKIASNAVTTAKMKFFKSSEQTGTGSEQSITHSLGATPGLVIVYPTDTSPSTAGEYIMTEGTHTSTVVKVTVTTGKKYKVVAFV